MKPFLYVLLGIRLTLAAYGANEPAANKTLRVFHIGNSLTFGVLQNPKAAEILSSRGVKYEFGWHILWGSSLAQIWEKADEPSKKTDTYGNFKEALANHSWDVLTLQPWASALEGEPGDVAMARKYIELAVKKSPDIQVYIYETWPGKDKDMKTDFPTKWAREYTEGKIEYPIYNATYCKELVNRLNRELPQLKKPVGLIPVGSVMFELDKLMKAGKVPGYERIEQVYNDGVHLKPVGNYIALCTFYAVLRKDSPRGLAGSVLDKDITDELAGIIQETTRQVVSEMSLTGVGGKGAASKPAATPRGRKTR